MTQAPEHQVAQPPTPTPPPLGTCDGCKFWESNDIVQAGRCRFNAPAQPHVHGAVVRWPVTEPKDWCGQWVAR